MEKIFLIDATSILFRAFYAVRNLSTSSGKRQMQFMELSRWLRKSFQKMMSNMQFLSLI